MSNGKEVTEATRSCQISSELHGITLSVHSCKAYNDHLHCVCGKWREFTRCKLKWSVEPRSSANSPKLKFIWIFHVDEANKPSPMYTRQKTKHRYSIK